jgi:hypothetical protein
MEVWLNRTYASLSGCGDVQPCDSLPWPEYRTTYSTIDKNNLQPLQSCH